MQRKTVYIFSLLLFSFSAFLIAGQNEQADSKNKQQEKPKKEIKKQQQSQSTADIWSEDIIGLPRYLEMVQSRINRFLNRLEKTNPQRAKYLRELQRKDPDAFREELSKEIEKHVAGHPKDKRPPERGKGMPGPQHQQGRFRRGAPSVEELQKKNQKFIEWLKKNYPKEAEKLQTLREKPQLYNSHLRRCIGRYGRIMEIQKTNPELAEVIKQDLQLQEQRDKLLQEIRKEKNKQKAEQIKKQLREIVSNRFDLIVRKKQLRFQELQKKLQNLQKELEAQHTQLEKLAQQKQQEVDKRVKELIGNTLKVNWD